MPDAVGALMKEKIGAIGKKIVTKSIGTILFELLTILEKTGIQLDLSDLLLFKLIANLYPVSDFQHPVITPTLVLMCQCLSQTFLTSGRDVCVSLFICNLLLEVLPSTYFLIRKVCSTFKENMP
jgi:hypothetical protein